MQTLNQHVIVLIVKKIKSKLLTSELSYNRFGVEALCVCVCVCVCVSVCVCVCDPTSELSNRPKFVT